MVARSTGEIGLSVFCKCAKRLLQVCDMTRPKRAATRQPILHKVPLAELYREEHYELMNSTLPIANAFSAPRRAARKNVNMR